eukprot:85121-Hanusia_phi.AAC.2
MSRRKLEDSLAFSVKVRQCLQSNVLRQSDQASRSSKQIGTLESIGHHVMQDCTADEVVFCSDQDPSVVGAFISRPSSSIHPTSPAPSPLSLPTASLSYLAFKSAASCFAPPLVNRK